MCERVIVKRNLTRKLTFVFWLRNFFFWWNLMGKSPLRVGEGKKIKKNLTPGQRVWDKSQKRELYLATRGVYSTLTSGFDRFYH